MIPYSNQKSFVSYSTSIWGQEDQIVLLIDEKAHQWHIEHTDDV